MHNSLAKAPYDTFLLFFKRSYKICMLGKITKSRLTNLIRLTLRKSAVVYQILVSSKTTCRGQRDESAKCDDAVILFFSRSKTSLHR